MRKLLSLLVIVAMLGGQPGLARSMRAQDVRTIDPNQAIDADLAPQAPPQTARPSDEPVPLQEEARYADDPRFASTAATQGTPADQAASTTGGAQGGAAEGGAPNGPAGDPTRESAVAVAAQGQTFKREELLRAAEGTFGKGAAGLAGMLEKLLREQGEPNAYIAGREAGGAVLIGLRYGKGELFHKVEGQQKIFWTGPSLGIDLGGDAAKVFVLVYNLYDTEELYRRFPAGEGRLFVIGGLAATYLRRGNIVVIPIRLGVGWRQGVNLGYMKFSHKSRWFPF